MATQKEVADITRRARAAALAEFNAGLIAVVTEFFKAQRVSRLPKVEAEEWTLGQSIYWVSGKASTAGAGPMIGTAAEPTVNPSSYGYVALADAVPRTTLEDVTTANATDAASAVTLANALKAKLNALLSAMRNGAAS